MRSLTTLLFGAVLLAGPSSLFAQNKPAPKPAPIAPAAQLKDGWEEIDKRLIFLMVRLANVEASLDAVEKSAGTGSRQQSARLGDAKRAERANELMDRKGGGPVKWSQFYGSTAEKFFYHPTDANTTYHTTTVLSQQSPANDNQVEQGIPSRQGVPVHQRPPQFDYIYKANRDAQARAEQEASQLRNKVDALQARRRQLEDEQAALWCQIAFRVVSRHDLPRHPRYRFEPIPFNADTASQQQAVAAEAAALYMRHALSIIEEAEKDQGKAFGSIKSVVADAREKFEDALLRLDTLREDTTDLKTAIGRYSALARRLQDIADNISDSYEVSIDGDRFKDEVRKDTFRGLLQQSLVDYAEVVLALDEMGRSLESEWHTKPNIDAPLKFVRLEMPERTGRRTVSETNPAENSVPANIPSPQEGNWISLFDGNTLGGWNGDSRYWKVAGGAIVGRNDTPIRGRNFLVSEKQYGDFELRLKFKLIAGNSGVQFRSVQHPNFVVSGHQADIAYDNNFNWMGCLGGEKLSPARIAMTTESQKQMLRQIVKQDDWNDLFLVANGSLVKIEINGFATVDTAVPNIPSTGIIGFQLHGGGSTTVMFKDIEIRTLSRASQ